MHTALFHWKKTFAMDWNFLPGMARSKQQNDQGASDMETSVARMPSARSNHEIAAPDSLTFIARQPIVDATEKVRGYQFLIRPGTLAPATPAAQPADATRLLLDSINTFGIAHSIGDRVAFVNMPPAVLESSVLELLPKTRFVLEYPASYLATINGPAQCAKLREQGFMLACAYESDAVEVATLQRCTDFVVFDLSNQTMQTITQLDRALKSTALKRLIRNTNSRTDFAAAKGFDFDLYQGNFHARPETIASNRMDPMRDRAIEILNLVMNRAEITEIEDAFKHDVALCYSLLCYINSVGIGLQFKVSSIRNAVMLLGYDFLWRWLSLLVYAGIDLSAAQRALLNTAIIRGRLAELLGQKALGDKGANQMFVTGAFSLLDALLGVPLEQALARIDVAPEMADAILRQEGRFSPYLELAIAFEQNNFPQAKRLCEHLDMSVDEASRAHIAAIEWASTLAK